MRLSEITCAVLTAVALAQPALAQSLDTPDLAAMSLDKLLSMPVTGGSKFASTVGETAAAVTLITREEIRALGYRTLAEALGTVKGVTPVNDRIYQYAGVRGFYAPGDYNTRVLLLVDGNRVNDAMYEAAYMGTEFPLDLALVERIEFIPGQASAVYGANALFGVVNVVTRQPTAATGLVGEATVGSFGQRHVRVGNTLDVGGQGLVRWSVSRSEERGDAVRVDDKRIRGGDAFQRTNLAVDAKFGEVTFSALHSSRNKAASALVDTDSSSLVPNYKDVQALLNLSWARAWSEGYDTLFRVFSGEHAYTGNWVMTYAPGVVNHDDARARWWGAEARMTVTRFKDHKLSFGAEFQKTPQLWQRNLDVAPAEFVYFDVRNTARRWAVYAEDQFKLTEHLTLDATVRQDQHADYGGQLSHRSALIWRPADALAFKAIYASAFRPPNAYEAYYGNSATSNYLKNDNLRAETVRGTELVAEWTPSSSDSLSASLYRNVAHGLVVQQYDASTAKYMYINQGSVTSNGVEFEWQHAWAQGAKLRANISHTRAADSGTASPVAAYAPAYLANLVLMTPVSQGLQLGTSLHASAKRGVAPPYLLAGMTLSSPELQDQWHWQVSVSNLFNRRYQDPGTDLQSQPVIEQAGRSVWLTVGRGF